MKKASEYHKQGYTCGEAMIKAYNEKNNTNIPISLGSGMGAGFTSGSMCGAVGAANIIIGFSKGRKSDTEENEARKYAKQLMEEVRGKHNTEICKDLKKNGISCADIIEHTFESLDKILNE
jgi:C_GCAxxG_C_C family probable redox protein